MGDLIIKPESGGSIKLQNNAGTNALVSDNSGNITLAGNTTLSVAGNQIGSLGTVTSGTLNGVTGMLRSTASASGRNVWVSQFHTPTVITATSPTDTGLALTVGAISGATDFLIFFNEDRREQSWNDTVGTHQYSIDGGSNWLALGETYGFWDNSYHSGSTIWSYQTQSAVYYRAIADGSTLQFRLRGHKNGNSNGYQLNYSGTKSSITAIKITQ